MQLSDLATASASAPASASVAASVAAWPRAGKYATPMRRSVQMPRNQKLLNPPPPHTHFSSVHCPPTYIYIYICVRACVCVDILFVRSQNLKTSLHKTRTTHTHSLLLSMRVCVWVEKAEGGSSGGSGLIYSQAGPSTALIINFNLIT